MRHDPRFEALFNRLNPNPNRPMGLLQKIGATAAAVVIFVLALAFSVMVFAAVAALAVVIGGYFWWRTRDLREAMRKAQAQAQARGTAPRDRTAPGGIVIEGEVVREVVEEHRNGSRD